MSTEGFVMQQELRFATFNVCNLAPPGMRCYDNLTPYTEQEYEQKTTWIAQQMDRLDADVIGFQEIFSQACIQDILRKTQHYRDAHRAGIDPDPQAARLTPSVALVSRFPIVSVTMHTAFPHNLAIALPAVAEAVTAFTRPVLQVQILVPPDLQLQCIVVHLKSKQADYRNNESPDDPYHGDLATLRSLIWRGAEALALRSLLSDCLQLPPRLPLIAMGDFNDTAAAVSTQLIAGLPKHCSAVFDDRLFDSFSIQTRRNPLRNVGYSHIHQGQHETFDHILVSEAFNPASRFAIGEVQEVIYLNDHLTLRQPEATDHGLVLARIRMYGGA
jgi:endonuclease/exonuclease/phosphatase family metal-dependent hydrolase